MANFRKLGCIVTVNSWENIRQVKVLIIVDTDHDQDLDPTAQDAINKQSSCS